jgi:DNA replication protein DnaC
MRSLYIPPNHVVLNPKFYAEIIHKLADDLSFSYLFVGPAGTGKTVLMRMIAHSAVDNASQYMYNVTDMWNDYFHVLCGSFDDKSSALDRRVNQFASPCLFLDDLGTERANPKSKGFIEQGLTKATEIDRGKPHRRIITTNLDGAELRATYGERVFDRLLEAFEIVKFSKVLKNNEGKPVSFREKEVKVWEL